MESSQRGLFIDVVVERFIFKNNQFTLFPSFTFIPNTGVELPKTGVTFYYVIEVLLTNMSLTEINSVRPTLT